jgi:hypothetical protein
MGQRVIIVFYGQYADREWQCFYQTRGWEYAEDVGYCLDRIDVAL